MPLFQTSILTLLTIIAFASNSLLCRLALKKTSIDPATFTSIRLLSGALVLSLLVLLSIGFKNRAGQTGQTKPRIKQIKLEGNWWSACALFIYALCFSLAYVGLPTASGALILFGAVQACMVLAGIWRGEHLQGGQWLGLLLACGGLVVLMLPGLEAPALSDALLMLAAGCAWGIYSLRGQSGGNPIDVTAGNFIRCVPLSLLMCAGMALLTGHQIHYDQAGVLYAIASGALASGAGYALWYSVLPYLSASTAASVQLSVPVIAAFGGIIFLQEALSPRLLLTSVAILAGIALVILGQRKSLP
ncbi:MAG: DMT family transporter [Burkholderiaceae bacterium]|nr:DMT family transporter [Burkholderiaceae bacterium]